jgi:uncharacterized protein (DUF3820 family)
MNPKDKTNFAKLRLKMGKHAGRLLCEVPKTYREWLLATAITQDEIATLNVVLSDRRIASYSRAELREALLDDRLTLNDHDAIKAYLGIMPPDPELDPKPSPKLTAVQQATSDYLGLYRAGKSANGHVVRKPVENRD